MASITTTQFLQTVYDWMSTHVQAIEANWPQSGGWEPWAQTELIGALNAAFPTVMAQREQHVYVQPANKVDLMVNDPDVDMRQVILCEMKCQSLNNAQNFVSGLTEDLYVMDHDLSPPFNLAQRVTLGFYFSERYPLPPGFAWNSQVEPTGNIGMCYVTI